MVFVEEIQALKSKSIEELYKLIGEQLLSETLGIDEFSDEETKEEAVDWENQQRVNLRKSICGSDPYRAYIENPEGWDWVMIVTALADLIAGVVVGVSPLTVAALILKKGLDKLCAEDEQ